MLNVHFHTLALDGVYVEHGDALLFHPLPNPTDDEMAALSTRIARRIQAVMRPEGRLLDDDEHSLADQPALTSCYGAALQGTSLFGARAGRPILRLVRQPQAGKGAVTAQVMGVNLHAGSVIDGRDRKRIERLCRYLARPPIAQQRLHQLPDGALRYDLKAAWRDGTYAVVLEPLDLIARLCAMVPPPRFHMLRYHGVLSSHAKLRSRVVPTPSLPAADVAQPQLTLELPELTEQTPRRRPWAWLLRHVFEADVTTCPRCSGHMRWLEVATSRDQIARLLAEHDVQASPSTRAPPHPQLQLAFPSS